MENVEQFSKEDAIVFCTSKGWKNLTYEQIAKFQINQKRLCVPFTIFHEAIEKTLGRSVYTHEFGMNLGGLKKELFEGAGPPTLKEIMEQIPKEKRLVVCV